MINRGENHLSCAIGFAVSPDCTNALKDDASLGAQEYRSALSGMSDLHKNEIDA